MRLQITEYEKDLPKLNRQLIELENYKRRIEELEKQIRRLTQKVFGS